ncbi:hypothetical protein STCU_04769 [Strigomonas culicis]|nr:hypothetical protein STCU_04769 [Strigomonas culicis]|eukprot:EPY29012.1 hypothetical protein STCU_04769 [Strigomonas culicis]
MAKNWNLRYQVAIENLLYNKKVSNSKAEEELHQLKAEFEGVAQELAATVLGELVQSAAQRRVSAHPTHTNYFYESDGMLLQLCIDKSSGVYGGDSNAQKIASRTFQSQQLLSSEGPRHLLYVPLMTRIKFAGHVFLATAIPPVNRKGCLYAMPASGAEPLDTPAVVMHALRALTEALNLKPHEVLVSENPEKRWKTALPVDMEVYVGRDRRMYLVNGGRLLPTVLPLTTEAVRKQRTSVVSSSSPKSVNPLVAQLLLRRLRPELLLGATEAINVDVGVDNCHSSEDIEGALKLSEYLRGDGPTAVAGQLGFHFPVNAPPLPSVPCTLCEASIDNELRFLCCRSPSHCCQICPNCFTKRMYEALAKEQAARAAAAAAPDAAGAAALPLPAADNHPTPLADFSDAVRCGGGARRWPLLGPSVTALMHANGVNMSHLPYVYYRLPAASRFAVKHFVEVELIARAATRLLHTYLRRCSTSIECAKEVEKLWVPLLQQNSPQAVKLWAKELGPEIEKCFPALSEPFDTSRLPTELLVERLQALSGVHLTAASAASFTVDPKNPFLEIEAIVPQIKSCIVPHLDMKKVLAKADFPEEVDRDTTKFDMGSILEKMLLFWIGYAPKDSEEALQPFYLADVATVQ